MKKSDLSLWLVLTLLMVASGVKAANIEKKIFTYNPELGLKLTRYRVAGPEVPQPCIIFAFGGGFSHGERDDVRYQPYFEFMAEHGYTVCSIDYRTLLAGLPADTGVEGFGQALVGAIQAATEDFLSATGYVLANVAEWSLDPARIIASGSSAGAITALQAEFQLAGNRPDGFPEGFNYAAAVTFAGALLSQGEPVISSNLCPMMLFQGDADSQVPYDKLVLGPIGLYGSHYLATHFKDFGLSGAFWTELGATHDMALRPMTENLYDIAGFLNHVLAADTPRYDWTVVTVPGRKEYKTDFTIMDYIRSNMQ